MSADFRQLWTVRAWVGQADDPLASRAFVLPVTALGVVLLFPWTFIKLILTFFLGVHEPRKQMRMYRFVYPLFLWMIASYAGAMLMRRKLDGWKVTVRDEVY